MHSKVALTFFESWLPSFRHPSSETILGTVKLCCDPPSNVQTSSHTVIVVTYCAHRSAALFLSAVITLLRFGGNSGAICPSCPRISELKQGSLEKVSLFLRQLHAFLRVPLDTLRQLSCRVALEDGP